MSRGKNARTWQKGERKRTVICSFCGEEHRRHSREVDECRARHRAGKADAPVAKTSELAEPALRVVEVLQHRHRLADQIMRLHRDGRSPRRIAKVLDLPVATVLDVIEREAGRM